MIGVLFLIVNMIVGVTYIVEVSTFRNILKAGVFMRLSGELIVGIRVCKNTLEEA